MTQVLAVVGGGDLGLHAVLAGEALREAAGRRNQPLDLELRGKGVPGTALSAGAIARADAVLLVGSNPAETMPPMTRHMAGARQRGGLIVIDPRHSATAALTDDGAGLHLQPLPGTDVVLLLGLLHAVIAASGTDDDYLAARVEGWDAVAAASTCWWPERTQQVAQHGLDERHRQSGAAGAVMGVLVRMSVVMSASRRRARRWRDPPCRPRRRAAERKPARPACR